MNNNKNHNIPTDDDWLDTTLHQWADRPVGKLSSDLHSQVVSRMAEPTVEIHDHRASIAIGALLMFSIVVGSWLILRSGNRENLASESKLVNPTVASKLRDAAPLIIEIESASPDQSIRSVEQDMVALQEVQRQVDSLQVELLIGQMDARIAEMERQCKQLKERVAFREHSCDLAAIKHGVITEWLANQ